MEDTHIYRLNLYVKRTCTIPFLPATSTCNLLLQLSFFAWALSSVTAPTHGLPMPSNSGLPCPRAVAAVLNQSQSSIRPPVCPHSELARDQPPAHPCTPVSIVNVLPRQVARFSVTLPCLPSFSVIPFPHGIKPARLLISTPFAPSFLREISLVQIFCRVASSQQHLPSSLPLNKQSIRRHPSIRLSPTHFQTVLIVRLRSPVPHPVSTISDFSSPHHPPNNQAKMRGFTALAALSALTMVSALNGTAFTIDPTEITLTLRGTV